MIDGNDLVGEDEDLEDVEDSDDDLADEDGTKSKTRTKMTPTR